MNSLPRQFPPRLVTGRSASLVTNAHSSRLFSTHGYSFLAWLSVESAPLDQDDRLIIFGCGDASGKCHVELSVTEDCHLAFSTSSTSPPHVFEAVKLELGRLYHVAVVHQRPRIAYASTATLYLDGHPADSARVNYPASISKDWDVQVWFGTTRNRLGEGRLQRGLSAIKWNLGPTWLLHADLGDDMVYVCWTLGPRYTGNFQDQLGQFQTNVTSTELNLRLDAMARQVPQQKPLDSPLVFAVRDKGSAVFPEHRIYFSFSAENLVSAGYEHGIIASGLSQHADSMLKLTVAARGPALSNSVATGRIDDELVRPHVLAYLESASVALVQPLDVGLWKIGGVSIILRLVELASTPEQVRDAVKLFVEIVGQSWRNSEDAGELES